ncbi:MAG: substrate-binding domain-containing protein [Bacteroides intestinalis]|nr:substrate-binding domain-containing protein [Bacteroides intestinalis]
MKTVKQLQLLGLAVILVLVSACQSKPKDGLTDTYTSGVIAIAADESFQPIVQEEVDVFEGVFPLAGIVPRYVTEVEAVNLLLKDSLRLAITSRRLTPEEMNPFNSRKFFPQEIKIATDGLALITNKDNPDTLITVNDIRDILTGKTTQWREIYPASRLKDIRLVFDNKNSSTVRFAVDSICKGAPLSDQIKALKTNREVIDFVSKTPDAIGIIGVNWLSDRNDSAGLSFSKEVRVMSVSAADKVTPENSFKPYQAYLFYGDYPLTRSIYALLNDPRSALPWGFASFLASDRGQRIILKSGLVPATQPVRVVNIKDK